MNTKLFKQLYLFVSNLVSTNSAWTINTFVNEKGDLVLFSPSAVDSYIHITVYKWSEVSEKNIILSTSIKFELEKLNEVIATNWIFTDIDYRMISQFVWLVVCDIYVTSITY